MKENLGLLLRLISNYVNHCEDIEDVKVFLRTVANYTSLNLTDEDKARMYHDTVHALNGGDENYAFHIRLNALISGDKELIEKIEYLHEVL